MADHLWESVSHLKVSTVATSVLVDRVQHLQVSPGERCSVQKICHSLYIYIYMHAEVNGYMHVVYIYIQFTEDDPTMLRCEAMYGMSSLCGGLCFIEEGHGSVI